MTMNIAFLHGGGQGSWVWGDTIEALQAQRGRDVANVLKLDVPGCGSKRRRSTDDLTLEDVAHELIQDIEASGLKDVVLVGHSQAGQAMALMMTRHPQLFQRFIYVSCSIPLPGQSVQQMIGQGLQGDNPEEVGWPMDPATTPIEQRYETMFCNDMGQSAKTEFLSELGSDHWPLATYAFTDWNYHSLDVVPSTFVLCLRDKILPAGWQHVFAERFRTERTVMIDAGHQVMNTRPHGLAEVIRIEADRSAI
ncbi:alpha/beta hydrolase [Novosphingobium sp. RD2P27]|uniref:Alpha/beta hydrolase n=1 Tax=Novosphingobium kalidii TaxID=3230299 RepID=A0ABV2D010_9SPHN